MRFKLGLLTFLCSLFLIAGTALADSYTIDFSSYGIYTPISAPSGVYSVNDEIQVSTLSGMWNKIYQNIGTSGFSDGDTFTEVGFISEIGIDGNATSFYYDNATPGNTLDDSFARLYISFEGLTGYVDNVVSPNEYDVFFTGATSITVYLDRDGNYDAAGDVITVATYDLVTGSGTGPSLESTGSVTGDLSFQLTYDTLTSGIYTLDNGTTFEAWRTMYGDDSIVTTIDILSDVQSINTTGDPWVIDISSQGNLTLSATAIPEPATFTLFGLSLLGLAGLSRKKTS